MILREEHFACIKINWENKLDNMLGIAGEINIGSDSLVFFDDDPMNRALIKQEMPEVLVIDLPKDPSRYARTLWGLNDFNTLQITPEDFNKGKLYSLQKKGQELKSKHSDLKSFLKDLKIETVIEKANDFTIPRISQLTMKTNQFNLTSRRYSEDDIRRSLESGVFFIYTVGVADRFGDNGLTGIVILEQKGEVLKVDTFLLSCRVIGRDIEKAVSWFIRKTAEHLGASEIVGEYIPTKKNSVCAGLYKDAGFESISPTLFRLTRLDAISDVDYISMQDTGAF